MNVFIDTNILIDFFEGRKPFATEAVALFSLAYNKKITIYCSALSYSNIFYLLAKSQGKARAKQALRDMRELVLTVPVDTSIIDKALENEQPDFEDNIQLECALMVKNIKALITRNSKDFKTRMLTIQTPKEFLDTYNY